MSDRHTSARRRGGLLGWFAAHPKATVVLFLLVLMALVVGLFDYASERGLQRRIAAIRAAGEPITLEDLNALRPVIPDEENMTLRLVEYGAALVSSRVLDDQVAFLPYIGTASIGPPGERMGPDQLAAARLYLAAVAEDLAGAHEALSLEPGPLGPTWRTPAISIMALSGLSEYRQVIKAFAVESAVALEDGRCERAVEIVVDMLHADAALKHDTALIHALVRFAAQDLAYECVERAVNRCILSDTLLRRLQDQVRPIEASVDMRAVMWTERAVFLDTLQWVRSGAGVGAIMSMGPALSVAPDILWQYLPGIPALDGSSGLDVLSRIVDLADKPDVACLQQCRTAEAAVGSMGWYCAISKMTIPNLSQSLELWIRNVGANRALRAALASERYRLANGEWPPSLEVLVPLYLDAVPVDPFDGQAIRFGRIDEGIRTWTIGEDLIDDGGDVGRLTSKRRSPDCGWVILNAELRGRPVGR